MKYICALITVSDISRSRHLYETILGQKVTADFGENIAFGGFAIHLLPHYEGLTGHKIAAGPHTGAELYFEEDDLPALCSKLENAGLKPVHPMREQPWRQQVARYFDYDGHILEFGETMEHVALRLHQEGKSVEEICRITYLPPEAVKAAIA